MFTENCCLLQRGLPVVRSSKYNDPCNLRLELFKRIRPNRRHRPVHLIKKIRPVCIMTHYDPTSSLLVPPNCNMFGRSGKSKHCQWDSGLGFVDVCGTPPCCCKHYYPRILPHHVQICKKDTTHTTYHLGVALTRRLISSNSSIHMKLPSSNSRATIEGIALYVTE